MVAYHLPNKDMLLRPHQLSNLILTFLVEMAEKVLQKLEEQLNCSICLDTSPVLPCLLPTMPGAIG